MTDQIYSGKKIFFLYPNSFIIEIIKEFIQLEFEIYIVKDHKILPGLLTKYNEAILFINIDEYLKQEEWQEFIRSLLTSPQTEQVKIGVLSYMKEDANLTKIYLMDIGVQCGFIHIRTDPYKCKKILLQTLIANEVRGQRKFVRAICSNKIDSFNVILNGRRLKGQILDISIAGMACYFLDNIVLENNSIIDDIQLVLRGSICRVEGRVVCCRKTESINKLYVIMFNRQKMKPEVTRKIHNFIFLCLQENIEKEINRLS